MIAIPRAGEANGAAGVQALIRNLGPVAAAVLFMAALAVVVMLIGPVAGQPVRLALGTAVVDAPKGWREALIPAKGVALSQGVLRLTEHPGHAEPEIPAGGLDAGPLGPFTGGPLPPAPIAGFFAPGPGGPLPVIASDGRTPFQAYARPFASNGRPKVALVIGGLGLNARTTRQAIETLPSQVTLSFAPYAEGLQGWIDMARAHGHEVLLETPMEPNDYPDNDPGPYTLMAESQGPDTAKKLEWILSRATGYFGLTNYLGSRFLSNGAAYDAFAGALRARGLGFIDDGQGTSRSGGQIPRVSADRVIDDQLSRKAIDQQLAALEAGALAHGQALGSGFSYPVTLELAGQWAREVESRGYQLAPASALARKK